MRGGMSLCGGFFEPLTGSAVILRYAFAVAVHAAKVELRVGIALRGGLLNHPDSLRIVLLLLRAAVAAKFCRVGEFFFGFVPVEHGIFPYERMC